MVLHAGAVPHYGHLKGNSDTSMPNAIDYASPGSRPGRGGAFKPLVARPQGRSIYGMLADTDSGLWVETIGRTLDSGAALLLSPTSDGGAFSVTLLDGDDRSRSYCATSDEVTACLQAVLAHVAPSESKATPTPLRRSSARVGR